MTDQPIEALLDEVDARLKKWMADEIPNSQYPASAPDVQRLSRELRLRIEREQWQPIETAPKDGTEILLAHGNSQWIDWWTNVNEIGGFWCMCDQWETPEVPSHWKPLGLLPTAQPVTTEPLKQQQQSEVEAALAELRQMFPDYGVLIDMDIWANVRSESEGNVSGGHAFITISPNQDGVEDDDFSGATLSEAMQKVRQWKEESK